MKKSNIVVAISLILCCFYSSLSVAGWAAPLKVLRIQSPPGGNAYFYMNAKLAHTECPDARFIRLTTGLKNYKEIYASMLMAKALDLDVVVRDTSGTCTSSSILTNPYIYVQ